MTVNQFLVISGQVVVAIGALSGVWAFAAIGFSLQVCAICFALENRDR